MASELEILRNQVELLKEEIFTTLRAFGSSRAHWCRYCKCHVIDGHLMTCPLIVQAIEMFGMEKVRTHIQVKEWDNYHTICEESRKRMKAEAKKEREAAADKEWDNYHTICEESRKRMKAEDGLS
jgi:hypothetical protein